jgi:hypothetical protein
MAKLQILIPEAEEVAATHKQGPPDKPTPPAPKLEAQPIPEGKLDPILEEAVVSQPVQPEPKPEPSPAVKPTEPTKPAKTTEPAPRFPAWGVVLGLGTLVLVALGLKGSNGSSSNPNPSAQPSVTRLPNPAPARGRNNW